MGSASTSTLAVLNMKGGVGKTTIAVNLASAIAKYCRKKVLLIDADPQCSASFYLLSEDEFRSRTEKVSKRETGTLYDLFHSNVKYIDIITGKSHGPLARVNKYYAECAPRSSGVSLSLVCGSPDLFEIQELAPELCIMRIHRWLQGIKERFDYVIIDCPPNISTLTLSVLKSCDGILVPTMLDQFSLYGLPILMTRLKEYRTMLGIKAKVSGVLINKVERSPTIEEAARLEQYIQAVEQICKEAKTSLLPTKISKADCYPLSVVRREPIVFSENPAYQSSIEELCSVSRNLKIVE